MGAVADLVTSVVGGVVDVLGLSGGGEASPQGSNAKQAYGGQYAEDRSQTGYQAKAARNAPGGASNDTLLTSTADLGNGTPDNAPDTTSDLGGSTGTAASEKQAEAGKRRDEIATKLYGK